MAGRLRLDTKKSTICISGSKQNMVYIQLTEKYRADAAELIKLFFRNGSF